MIVVSRQAFIALVGAVLLQPVDVVKGQTPTYGPYQNSPQNQRATLGWYVGLQLNPPIPRGIPDAATAAVINNCRSIVRAGCVPDGTVNMAANRPAMVVLVLTNGPLLLQTP